MAPHLTQIIAMQASPAPQPLADDRSLVLGQEVPIPQIDKALRQLWASDSSRTNACLINFAVYSEQPRSLEKNSAIVSELMQEHACRALLIEMDRSITEASIRAWVTAHCNLRAGSKSVCCEQIAFALTGVSQGRLRNTVFAHLSSELPLIFWWQGNLSPMFEQHLHSVVDRFIFDSAEWQDPSIGFASISRALESKPQTMVIQDLAWTRCFHFRMALANLLDDPLAMEALAKVSEVEIVCHPAHRISALQLLAWLKTQSQWANGLELQHAAQPKSTSENFCFHWANGSPIDVKLCFDEQAAPLAALHLRGKDLSFSVTREPSAAYLNLHFCSGSHGIDSLLPAACDGTTALIGEQLARGGRNTLFQKILPVFVEML
jgi:glucose-6-phosphate dehydrogenase assembly protein OpcA